MVEANPEFIHFNYGKFSTRIQWRAVVALQKQPNSLWYSDRFCLTGFHKWRILAGPKTGKLHYFA
jgi:hypothetical protein